VRPAHPAGKGAFSHAV
jgi:TRAP-type uncharacterized transport system substrate-binding protein